LEPPSDLPIIDFGGCADGHHRQTRGQPAARPPNHAATGASRIDQSFAANRPAEGRLQHRTPGQSYDVRPHFPAEGQYAIGRSRLHVAKAYGNLGGLLGGITRPVVLEAEDMGCIGWGEARDLYQPLASQRLNGALSPR